MAHFSKFVQRGARNVAVETAPGLFASAFVNLNGERVLVVLNRTEQDRSARVNAGDRSFWVNAKARSLATLRWKD